MESTRMLDQLISFISAHSNTFLLFTLNALFAILIFVFGQIISKFISKQFGQILTSRKIDNTVVKFVKSLSYCAIMLITLVAVLDQIGIRTTSLVAIIGAAGLAIGLSLQSSLSNFSAGVLLIIFRPFKVGETVTINNLTGTIDAVEIFQTTLITDTNEMVVIPNNQIISTNIINFSRFPDRRIDVTITVNKGVDIQKVLQILEQAVDKTENKLNEAKNSSVRLSTLEQATISFVISVWVHTNDYLITKANLLENINNLLAENKIS